MRLTVGKPDGYKFQIIGDPQEDIFILLGKMILKIRRALSIKHIKHDIESGIQIVDETVRGRIESSCDDSLSEPVIIIDGREITWGNFGRMLMSFEGWQFKLEIVDPSDEP